MTMKQTSIALSLALLLAGCTQSSVPVAPKPVVQKVAPKPVVKKPAPVVKKQLPPPPKKNIKLREVDDTNFNPDYMYPEDKKAAPKTVEKAPTPTEPAAATAGMSKEECIGMITQEKFDKYTAMFGSEEASIKRCNMLKAMQ
jgi:hypothetical protein